MTDILSVSLIKGCCVCQFGLKQLRRTWHPNANSFNVEQYRFRICGIRKATNRMQHLDLEFTPVHFHNDPSDDRSARRRHFQQSAKPGMQRIKQGTRSEQIQVFAGEWLKLEQFGGNAREKIHRPRIDGVTANNKGRLALYDRTNDLPEIAKNSGGGHVTEPSIPAINPLKIGRQIDDVDR